MTISEDYFRLLDHLGPTRPVRDLLGDDVDLVALRHDVDHDLDLALEMAFWEHRRGTHASYFLLPSAPYWDDPLLEEKVAQLVDYEHEVGIHLNGLAEWADGRIDDIPSRLRSTLGRLRAAGAEVIGSSAHGDRSCYAHGVINNWVFAELRPADPEHEDGLSAEGVPSPDPAFRIPWPGDVVRRDDGAAFDLWSLSMADLGLRYEAVRLPMDRYWSDSGGTWSRSPDPRQHDLSSGRHQVLVHPEYHRGPQRFVFVLSTARSGSKWMTRALGRATNASVSHEHTLNHVLDDTGQEVLDHRTGAGFTSLLVDRDEVRRRIAQVRAVRDEAGGDHVECNVYLPHCLPELRAVYPDATFVHLHRDPYLVVRSLMNREWYDTRYDDRHPVVELEGWDSLTQVEKCCAYVTATTIDLLRARQSGLGLRDATTSPSALIEAMVGSGVAVHRRLLEPLLEEVVDPTRSDWVGPPDRWDATAARTLRRDLAQARRALGYWPEGPGRDIPSTARDVTRVLLSAHLADRAAAVGGGLEIGPELVLTTHGDRHAYVLLAGGAWRQLGGTDGWTITPGAVVLVRFEATREPPAPATVFGLTYSADGKLIADRRLAPLRDGPQELAFRPRPDGSRFNVGLHVPMAADESSLRLAVRDLRIEEERPVPPVSR